MRQRWRVGAGAVTIAWTVLGVLVGGIGGFILGYLTPGADSTINLHDAVRNAQWHGALCAVIGAGFGSVTGAILGGITAILDAIGRPRPMAYESSVRAEPLYGL